MTCELASVLAKPDPKAMTYKRLCRHSGRHAQAREECMQGIIRPHMTRPDP
ncbi:hypothetical protein [Desulfallas thermosapovorans]|uniref:hypothetical protein n=1 Tax=Desulfallas thermosapovorans TaxID=58137 RepID=UPI001411F938|nr:hypothetical protein [Desulfallas thermosapovorans]